MIKDCTDPDTPYESTFRLASSVNAANILVNSHLFTKLEQKLPFYVLDCAVCPDRLEFMQPA